MRLDLIEALGVAIFLAFLVHALDAWVFG